QADVESRVAERPVDESRQEGGFHAGIVRVRAWQCKGVAFLSNALTVLREGVGGARGKSAPVEGAPTVGPRSCVELLQDDRRLRHQCPRLPEAEASGYPERSPGGLVGGC